MPRRTLATMATKRGFVLLTAIRLAGASYLSLASQLVNTLHCFDTTLNADNISTKSKTADSLIQWYVPTYLLDFPEPYELGAFWLDRQQKRACERKEGRLEKEAATTTRTTTIITRQQQLSPDDYISPHSDNHPEKHKQRTQLTQPCLNRRNLPTSRRPSPSSTSAALDVFRSTLWAISSAPVVRTQHWPRSRTSSIKSVETVSLFPAVPTARTADFSSFLSRLRLLHTRPQPPRRLPRSWRARRVLQRFPGLRQGLDGLHWCWTVPIHPHKPRREDE